MSRVLALVPDLLFGSKVKAMLEAAGHDVEMAQSETDVWDQIAGTDVLVVDLASGDVDGARLLDTLRSGGEAGHVKALAFYSHVDEDAARGARAAGWRALPRGRFFRELPNLLAGISAGGSG